MESSDAVVGDARDAWMRRAGPFFGLLVAARAQTRLPLAPELDPTDADRQRGLPWWPAVGALLGLALGFAAAILAELGLAAGVVAALIACLWVVAGGGWAELDTARSGDRLISRGDESGSLAVVLSIALVVSLLLRGAALVGISVDYWTAVLIVAPVVARWTPVAAALTRALVSMRKTGDEAASLPVGLLVATAAVCAVAIILGGSAGIFALVVAALTGAGVVLLRGESADAPMIFGVELVALLCFAAADTYPLL